MHGEASTFCAAVNTLHTGGPDAVAANAWLVAFADEPTASHVCSIVLTTPTATVPQQVFAAGIIGRLVHHADALDALLQLIGAPGVCAPAAASLGGAIAAIATRAGAEDTLLASPAFGTLAPSVALPVLHALAESLAQSASVEELRVKRSTMAASHTRCAHTST